MSVLAGLLGLMAGARGQQPLVQLQGQPYFGGSMTLHVTAPSDIGDIVWLAVGLNPLPLDAPVPTNKGPWYIGNLLTSFLVGTVQGNGRMDMPFTMPPVTPGVEGVALALQAYVAPMLSHPATLPLDGQYYLPSGYVVLTSPQPSAGANFGDRVASGDMNGDGHRDLIAGAWSEDHNGVESSGRTYVLWGPSFSASTPMDPPAPTPGGGFGCGLAVFDGDGDGFDDLMVGAGSGYPFTPEGAGHLYFFSGGPSFTTSPGVISTSALTGNSASLYGRRHAIGDLNDDGFLDVAVGLPNASVGSAFQAGRVHVHWGPAYQAYQELVSPLPEANDNFGSQLAVGDVNGDLVEDLIEGSARDDVGGVKNVGSIHLFAGGNLDFLANIPNPLGSAAQAGFASEVSAVDLDADQTAEVLVSDELDHVFSFWDATATDYLLITKASTGVGPLGAFGALLDAEDTNHDGQSDVLISNMFEGACSSGQGGSLQIALAPYFNTFMNLNDMPSSCSSLFGGHFVIADLDGDGMPDLVVGDAVADDGALSNSGHVTIVFWDH